MPLFWKPYLSLESHCGDSTLFYLLSTAVLSLKMAIEKNQVYFTWMQRALNDAYKVEVQAFLWAAARTDLIKTDSEEGLMSICVVIDKNIAE